MIVYVTITAETAGTAPSVSTPTGFTARVSALPGLSTSSPIYSWEFYEIATTAGTVSASVAYSSGGDSTGVIVAFSGVNTVTPFDTGSGIPDKVTATTAVTSASGSVTTTGSNELVIGLFGLQNTAGTVTATAPSTAILTSSPSTLTETYAQDEPASTAGTYTSAATFAVASDYALTVDAIDPAPTPTVTFSPSGGTYGAPITLSGTGFAVSDTISATLNTPTPTTLTFNPSTCTVGSLGSFSCTFDVPDAAQGSYTITATGSPSGDTATSSGTFTVNPALTLAPASGYVGGSVTVDGHGFTYGATITSVVASPTSLFTTGSCTASPNVATVSTTGTFTCEFTVAKTPHGAYTVTATESTGSPNSALATFNVEAFLTVPSAIDTGQTVTFSGNGYTASSPITFTGSGLTFSGSCTTDGTGTFSCPITVTGTGSSVSITATDGSLVTNSNSALMTVNTALGTPTLSPSSTQTLDLGQAVTFTVSWSGGTSPYTAKLYEGISSSCASDSTLVDTVSPATSAQAFAAQTPGSTGTFYYCATITDSATSAETTTSSTTEVVVNSALGTPTLSPSSPQTVDLGQLTTFTVSWSGGTSPYTAKLYEGTSSSCASDTTDVQTVSPATSPQSFGPTGRIDTGTVYFCATITDSATSAETTSSPTTEFTTNPELETPTLSPSSTQTLDLGQTITFSATWSGGTPDYTAVLESSASSTCTSPTTVQTVSSLSTGSASFTAFTPSSTLYYCVAVTDSATTPVTMTSSTTEVVVNSALGTPTLSPSSTQTLDSGQGVIFSASWTGGTSPYAAVLYSGSSSTCSSDTSEAAAVSPVSSPSATFTELHPTSTTFYCVVVTDSATTPETTSSSTTEVVVNSALAAPGTPTVSATALDVNQALTVTGTIPSTGTSPYAWTWLVSIDGVAYTTATQCATNSGTGALAGATETCSIAVNTLTVGDTYAFELQVTDSATSAETTTSGPSSTVTVASALGTPTLSPSSTQTLDLGQTVTFTVSWSGGTSPYTAKLYLYEGASSSCASDNNLVDTVSSATSAQAFAAQTPGSTGTFYYCATITDSATSAETTSSSATQVIVDAAPVIAVTPLQGPVGAAYQVVGTDFAGSSSATVSFNGVDQTPTGGASCTITGSTITTSATGGFTCTFVVPSIPSGSYPIVGDSIGVSPISGTAASSSTYFLVTTVTISSVPAGGTAGATYTVTGSGFSVDSSATVSLNGVVQTPTGGTSCTFTGSTITTSATGGFVCTFAVPNDLAQGGYSLVGTDVSTADLSNSLTFTINPLLTLSLTTCSAGSSSQSGTVGTAVEVCGYGFNAGATITTVTFSSPSFAVTGNSCPPAVTVSADGTFSCGFTLAPTPYGSYTITATESSSPNTLYSASATFQVEPSWSFTPSGDTLPQVLTMTGTGFVANHAITFASVSGDTIFSSGTCVSLGTGSFSCTITVLASPDTAQTFTAYDGTNMVPTDSTFTATPTWSFTPSGGTLPATLTASGTGFGSGVAVVIVGVPPNGSQVTWSYSCGTTVTGNLTACTITVVDSPAVAVSFTANGVSTSSTFTATPSISVSSPSPTFVGSTITVTGTGFYFSDTISFTLSGAAGSVIATCSTNTEGTIGTCTFTVPDATAGSHTVTASDTHGNSASVNNAGLTQTITVVPSISVSAPSPTYVGSTVTVTGAGFAAGATISFTLSGAAASVSGTCSTNTEGTIEACTFSVPAATNGVHTLTASDGTNSASVNNADVTQTISVQADLTSLSETTGFVGDTVTVTGTGFTGGLSDTTFTLILGGSFSATATCSTDTYGTITGTCSFTVPAAPQGAESVTLMDSNSVTSTNSVTFTIDPAFTISPSQGPAGSTFTFTATGYAASTDYQTSFDSVTVLNVASCTVGSVGPVVNGYTSFETTSAGSATCVIDVPTSGSGSVATTYEVTAGADLSPTPANLPFTVTVPTISVSPSGGAPGATYVVSGTGFSVDESVTLAFGSLGDQTPSICSVGTFSSTTITTTGTGGSPPGAFTCSFSVPEHAVLGTYYSIQATDVHSSDLSNAVSFLVGSSYVITFTETGLTGGTWQVVIGGTTLSATYPTDTITFTGLEGTAYGYSVSNTNSQTTTPSFGVVSEASPSVSVSFGSTPPTPGTFTVTFSETGLSAGSWTVVVDGVTHSEPYTTATITVNGLLVGTTYGYSVSDTNSETATPSFGMVSATGTVNVVFAVLSARPVAPLASPAGAGPAAAASGMIGSLAATLLVLSVAVSAAGMLGVALVLLRTRTRIEERGNDVPTGSRRHEK